VSGEDVIIGKTTPLPQDDNASQAQRYRKRDQSTCLRHSESGMIDQYLLCQG
jgi:DNA-directed RNA polymerase II subunit RPB2